MNTIKIILVPVDFTEYSLQTLEAAATIAKKNNSQLIALHVLDVSSLTMADISDTKGEDWSFSSLEERALNLLDYLKNNITKKYSLEIKVMLKKGTVVSSIIKAIEETSADLIIIGTHGTGDRTIFLGSHAYFIVMRSNRPVIAIPNSKEHSAFTKIIFMDESQDNIGKKIELLKKIIQKKDFILEMTGLIKNGSKTNINTLNETINYLGNKILENKIQSSKNIKNLVQFVNGTLSNLKVELTTISDKYGHSPNTIKYYKIPIISITQY